jgi:hypothetical protein
MPSDQDESPEDTLQDVCDGQDLSELLARLGESKRPSPIGQKKTPCSEEQGAIKY